MTAGPDPARRTPVVGGNWKMHRDRPAARSLIEDLRKQLEDLAGPDSVEVVVLPPTPWLADASELLAGSPLHVGAQNIYWEPEGAYTGEIAASMLPGVAEYVLVGHSERRIKFGETVWETSLKVRAVVEAGLTPLLAVGEPLADLRAGRTNETLRRQLHEGMRGTMEMPDGFVIAYEPVWAIGTGEAASPEAAEERCAFIRELVAERYGADAATSVRIQYGGSVNAENAAAFFAQPDIDGALVGGASLDAEAFTAICRAAAGA